MNSPLAPVTSLAPRPRAESLPTPERSAVNEFSLGSDLEQLTKARLTFTVVLTTLAGYGLASRGEFDWLRLFHTLLGTTLVAICSSILNQAMERDIDSRMRRTERRPLVTRRLPFAETVAGGVCLGAVGLTELGWLVNGLTAFLAALTLMIYLVIYTPLKRMTALNTLVGTIPGALPPLLGATAARGHFSVEGWTLFAILALWQLPHFYAIAWLYRDDYVSAGLRMVSVGDTTGRRTARHALVTAILLFPVSLLPALIAHSGLFYLSIAGVLSVAFIVFAFRFAEHPDRPHARRLFLFSISYLPLLLITLALDIPLHAYLGR